MGDLLDFPARLTVVTDALDEMGDDTARVEMTWPTPITSRRPRLSPLHEAEHQMGSWTPDPGPVAA